jgi:glycosyltransferase involved in cell wall biosynthesis
LPTDADRALPTIWFDLTTSIKLGEIPPVGITRVESRFAAYLLRTLPERVGFCRVDRSAGRYRIVSAAAARRVLDPDRRIAAAPDRAPRRRGRVSEWGRAVERRFRLWRRGLIAGLADRHPVLRRLYGVVPFAADDLFVIGGDIWERQDLARIERVEAESGVAIIVLCHDLMPVRFPHYFLPDTAPSFERFLASMLRRASLFVCFSATTLGDLQAYAAAHGATLPQAAVVTLGHDVPSAGEAPRSPGLDRLQPGKFVLCVGTIQVRKNHQLLYQVWRRLAESRGDDLPVLVLAGLIGWLVDDLLYQIRNDPLIAGRIVIIDRATDAELSWLYRNCRFTLYPSFYEGFGLPIAESLAHGKACIASSTSAMPEAGRGFALHLDPLDFAAWLREIESLLDDSQSLAAIEQRIRADYRAPDWAESGAAFVAVLSDFIARRPRA